MSDTNETVLDSNSTASVETAVAGSLTPSTGRPDYTEFDLDLLISEYLGEEAEASDNHSLSTQEILKELPSDALKLIQNLRKDYSRKTQQIATQKKELESRERNWLTQQEQLLRSKMNLPEDFDITSDGGLQAYINSKVAEMVLESSRPLREQVELETKRQELQTFKSENPDIDKYRVDIINEMSANPDLDLKTAYYIVKGRTANDEINKVKLELEKQKADRAAQVAKVGVGGAVRANGTPVFKNAVDALNWLKTKS